MVLFRWLYYNGIQWCVIYVFITYFIHIIYVCLYKLLKCFNNYVNIFIIRHNIPWWLDHCCQFLWYIWSECWAPLHLFLLNADLCQHQRHTVCLVDEMAHTGLSRTWCILYGKSIHTRANKSINNISIILLFQVYVM